MLGSQQNWAKSIEFSLIYPPLHPQASPYYYHPPAEGTFVTTDEPISTLILTQSPQFTLEFTLGAVHSEFWQMYNDMYSLLQNIFKSK